MIKAYLITRLLVYAGESWVFMAYPIYFEGSHTRTLDRFLQGSTATRVFSVVESPNILGSIFILMIPLCLALVLQRGRASQRISIFVLLGAMSLLSPYPIQRCVVGAALAMFIFCFAINPRWLFLLGAGGGAMLCFHR